MHWRQGGHAQNQFDWLALLDFADLYFYGKKPKNDFSILAYPDTELPIDWQAPSER